METGSPGKRPVLPKRARLLVTAGMGMLALLLFGPRLVDIYVDWLWFGEVGFRSVWITVLLTRLAIVAAVALVVAGIVLAALLLAYRSRPFFVPDEPQRDPVAPLRSAVMRRPRLFGWGIAVTLGVVCGLIASFDWVKVQLFVHGGTFGIVDPEFGYDIGFFVFDLPFYRSVLTLTQGPQQIQNSMISDTRVASERTLLERSNRIHYGNLLSLPIADGGVLYVEPLYTERISTSPSSSTFPQLSRVLVSVREPRTEGGVRVGYAPTLAESLDQVFGPGTGRVATAPGGDAASAPPPGAGGPAPPQAVPPPRTTQPPAAPPRGPDVPPATVAELRETLADLRAVLDRLEKAIDAAETPGG